MVCRRKEFKGSLQWTWGIGIKKGNRTRTCTYVLSIWQFLRLGNQRSRGKIPGASALGEPTVSSVIRHLLKDEINYIFSTTYIIIVVYMEIAMPPSLGFLSDSSSPSPSLSLVLCPRLHLLICSQPLHERTLWNVPVVAFKDFLSWCCGSKEQKHTWRITLLALTTCDISYT